MSSPAALLLDRLLGALAPLVRLLIRHGVTYPALASALKRVFLAEADAELRARGMARTDSALTLLSGVHRRDVRTLLRSPAARTLGAGGSGAAAQAASLGLVAEVMARWLHDPAYSGRLLARAGAGGFDELVQGLSSDVRPRAVLDELLRLGVVQQQDGDAVEPTLRLDSAGFVPRQGFAEMTQLLADNLRDHAAAAAANLDGEGNFLEQAVFIDDIGEESAARLQAAAVAAWKQAFASVVAEARGRLAADAAELPPAERRQRARFGVYFFSAPDQDPGPPP